MFSRSVLFFYSALALSGAEASTYDNAVLQDGPVLYLPLAESPLQPLATDMSGHGHHGAYKPANSPRQSTRLPNGDRAAVFNGASGFVEVASDAELSVPNSGVLTIEAWIRPDTLQFPHQEGDGYVHWAGKGQAGAHEYAVRMYSLQNTASPPRPNRISGYAFNLAGGLGSGSYFQDPVTVGKWIAVAVVINTVAVSSTHPTGYVRIYKDGVLRKTTGLNQFSVVPDAGPAPLRIGTRDLRSFFKGAIAKFALYDRELSAARLATHVRLMKRRLPMFDVTADLDTFDLER